MAKVRLDSGWLQTRHPVIEADAREVTALRCCLIKKEHLAVLAVVDALADALGRALG